MSANVTETKFLEVPSQSLLVDGGSDGKIAILGACTFFKVGQRVLLKSTSQSPLKVKINRFLSDTEFLVGDTSKNVSDRIDISAYQIADSATVDSLEQPRPSIPPQDVWRYVYSEEPTLALRHLDVDECGNPYNKNNPKPVEISGITIPPLEVMLTRKDDDPNSGDVHDSIRIGSQTVEWDFKDKGGGKGDGRVTDSLHCGGTNTVIEVKDTPKEIKVSAVAKADRRTITAIPKAKGVAWGFKSNVDLTNGINGGTLLGKNQSLEIDAEANTPVYLVGPASGVFVSITEA